MATRRGAALVRLAWHGGPSFTLGLGRLEVLVDPSFSRPGDYPPWFDAKCANPHAPTVAEYLERFRPDYLFITHGHFDHFDLVTVRKLAAALDFRVVGSAEVLRVCREELGLAPERLFPCPARVTGADGPWLALAESVRVNAVPGPHWFTGDEGGAVAARFAGRPDRYGAMPCGGPMLGFVLDVAVKAAASSAGIEAGWDGASGPVAARRVYLSGDTEPQGFPTGPFDVAVVSCGGELLNPATKKREGPFLDEAALARAACLTLRPEVLVPVHHDHPVFLTPFSLSGLKRELDRYPDPPRLVVPRYGTWEPLAS